MLKIAAILLLLAQTSPLRVVGRVEVDATNRGGEATLERPDGRTYRRASVDRDGRFDFGEVETGSYWVHVRLTGFEGVRRTVQIRPSLADADGRVVIRLELPAGARDERQYTVSVTELEIPDEAVREFQQGMDMEADGNLDGMRRHLERAIEIAPHFEQALNNLGATYHREGDFARSIELFEQALRANPDSFEARVNLGGSLLSDGQLERAVTENRRAIEIRPGSSLANAQMASALFFLGRDQEAIGYFETLKELDPLSNYTPELFLANIHLRNGDPEGATGELEAFLDKLPDHPRSEEVRELLEELEAAMPDR